MIFRIISRVFVGLILGLVSSGSGVAFARVPASPPSSLGTALNALLTRETKLSASDAAAGDRFGSSVAVSGDTAVVGAFCDGDGGDCSGSVSVFVRRDGAWSQQQKLTASDAAVGSEFGRSVAISGNTAVIGAPFDSSASGSAYVFVRNGSVWTQQQKLTATDAAALDQFGNSVAISGDTAVVGSPFDDDAGDLSGSAYVFVRSGGVWGQEQKLTASDAAPDDDFGWSVAVSGGTAVVGAVGDDDAGEHSGSAYVFVRSGGAWSLQQKLTASDPAAQDYFGWSVTVSGDTAAIGSPFDSDAGSASGSADVFVRAGGVWSHQQKLTASDAAAGDELGLSVAVGADSVVVGAPGDGDGGPNSGSAYVFARSGGVWSQQQKLTASDAAAGDLFGFSVAISGDMAVVGAPFESDAGFASGSAYVYEPPGSSAKVWVGLKNSDDVGLRLDLLAEVFVNATKVGQGELDNVGGGSSGFNNAILNTIPLNLAGGGVTVASGDVLSIRVSARRTCFGGGHFSGTARLWYNGRPVDTGSGRDAGSRFDATIAGTDRIYFLRTGSRLSTAAGSSRASADALLDSKTPCPARPFTPFGTWSISLP